MVEFSELPSRVIERVIGYLPQQDVINLMLTNYQFYQPGLKKLYRKISIQIDPILVAKPREAKHYKIDYLDSNETVLYGFQSTSNDYETHEKLLKVRITALILAIRVNHELAEYIEEIYIDDHKYKIDTIKEMNKLFEVLSSLKSNLKKIYTNHRLRKLIKYKKLVSEFKLESVIIDSIEDFNLIRGNERELMITFKEKSDFHYYDFGKLSLDSLIIINDEVLYGQVIKYFNECFRIKPFIFKLQKFNYYHSHYPHELPFINFDNIKQLQLSIGCNELQCQQTCYDLSQFEYPSLDTVLIIQNTNAKLTNHENNEKWDITIFNYIRKLFNQTKLTNLSIRHNPNNEGIINDGYEGNYLRREKLYGKILPNFLTNQQGINLFYPNLVTSLSCYEPAMNVLMWNGCKCAHCTKYLGLLDEFLIHHKYYNFKTELYKDLITCNLISVISTKLSSRLTFDELIGDFLINAKPLKNISWDFHQNQFSIPFKCLNYKNYEEADFEDDKDPIDEELYFDAESCPNDCKFYNIPFHNKITICISHYVNDLILKMINLNRGNAEDVVIGGINDENDGSTSFQLNKLLINGLVYHFDHELNGTAFFSNIHDDT